MSRLPRHEYLQELWPRYQKATRTHKKILSDNFCEICGYHRKPLLSGLNCQNELLGMGRGCGSVITSSLWEKQGVQSESFKDIVWQQALQG